MFNLCVLVSGTKSGLLLHDYGYMHAESLNIYTGAPMYANDLALIAILPQKSCKACWTLSRIMAV